MTESSQKRAREPWLEERLREALRDKGGLHKPNAFLPVPDCDEALLDAARRLLRGATLRAASCATAEVNADALKRLRAAVAREESSRG